MLPFHVFAATHLRPPCPPPHLRALCDLRVEIPAFLDSCYRPSSRISPEPGQKNPFQISALRTFTSSVSCKSFVCHSYENCRAYTVFHLMGGGGGGTFSLFCSSFHSLHQERKASPLHSVVSTLFLKTAGCGGNFFPHQLTFNRNSSQMVIPRERASLDRTTNEHSRRHYR